MPAEKIACDLKKKRVLVSDGAWGTMLHEMGLRPGECPESWNLTRYKDVLLIGQAYVSAGAEMLKTNSLGANRFKLSHFGLSEKVCDINEAAARASREAAGPDIRVIASMGPTGRMIITGDVTGQDLYEAFSEQAAALEKGGADAVCIETMIDLQEAVQAIKAAKENTKCEIICTFTFEKTIKGDYRTIMGNSISEAMAVIISEGADIIGTNCGNGFRDMIDIVAAIRKTERLTPVLVHANAGRPVINDGKISFPETPEMAAETVPGLIKAGADIIGGCCGTTPAHIRAIRDAVDNCLKG